jgi:hypothetical protein
MEENFEKSNGAMPGDQIEEISLEELLAELEGLEEGRSDEDEDFTDEDGSSIEAAQDTMNRGLYEEAEDDDEVGIITVKDLKDMFREVMADVMGNSEEADEEEEEAGEEEEMAGEEEEMAGDEELSLEELLAELGEGTEEKEKVEEGENEELEEAMSTIAQLRSELNEVNLLNAKLLYVNKLFKSKNLTEAQKVKVINAFDRAESVKETKNIFETLQESLTATQAKKNPIKESLSFASKSAGVADRKPIVENNDFVARMQKLAGIK